MKQQTRACDQRVVATHSMGRSHSAERVGVSTPWLSRWVGATLVVPLFCLTLAVTPDASAAAEAERSAPALNVPSGRYGLDKTHGYISFSYSHLGFSNPEVGFNEFDVELNLNAKSPAASSFTVEIDATSVDSRVAEFDRHLAGADYFDTAAHPTINFVSTGIEITSETTATITGDLTIKGVTHEVVLDAVLNKADAHPLLRVPALGVSARGQLSRSQWGLSKYVPMVSDTVELRIEVELPMAKDLM